MDEKKNSHPESLPEDSSKVYGATKPYNPKEKKGDRTKRKVKWFFIGIIVLVLVIGAAIVLPLTLDKAKKDAIIRVPKNATVEMVGDSVAKYLGRDYADKVQRSLKMFGFAESDRHGAYLITEGMRPIRAGRVLSTGGQYGINVTINGQRTKEDIARLIASKLDITQEEMLAALNDSTNLSKHHADPNKVMNFFLNNTYQFFWNATPEDVITTLRKEYRKFWDNDRLELAEELRLSPREISIIASIVDEETNAADEKGRVGRLYINRLNRGMKLQADPTVRYALNDFTIKRISLEDTKTPSPYNTYFVEGLPPGPIRTPDPQTIDAILHSNASNEIFMCADPSFNGKHRFAADYETHKRNAEEYQQALNRNNIHR